MNNDKLKMLKELGESMGMEFPPLEDICKASEDGSLKGYLTKESIILSYKGVVYVFGRDTKDDYKIEISQSIAQLVYITEEPDTSTDNLLSPLKPLRYTSEQHVEAFMMLTMAEMGVKEAVDIPASDVPRVIAGIKKMIAEDEQEGSLDDTVENNVVLH